MVTSLRSTVVTRFFPNPMARRPATMNVSDFRDDHPWLMDSSQTLRTAFMMLPVETDLPGSSTPLSLRAIS